MRINNFQETRPSSRAFLKHFLSLKCFPQVGDKVNYTLLTNKLISNNTNGTYVYVCKLKRYLALITMLFSDWVSSEFGENITRQTSKIFTSFPKKKFITKQLPKDYNYKHFKFFIIFEILKKFLNFFNVPNER